MIDGEYLAGRTISHLINVMRVAEYNINRISKEEISFFGIDYLFNVEGSEVDVRIERIDIDEKKRFNEFLKNTEKSDFWKKDFLSHLREQRDSHKKFIRKPKLYLNDRDYYHFKIKLNTKNDDNAFFAVFYNSIRVANLYNDPRLRV